MKNNHALGPCSMKILHHLAAHGPTYKQVLLDQVRPLNKTRASNWGCSKFCRSNSIDSHSTARASLVLKDLIKEVDRDSHGVIFGITRKGLAHLWGMRWPSEEEHRFP